MSEDIVRFITEGATEREVGLVLHKRRLLYGATPKSGLRGMSREGYDTVVTAMRGKDVLQPLEGAPGRGLLLIFDQDEADSPRARADRVGGDLGLSFDLAAGCEYENVFLAQKRGRSIVLHVSDAAVGSITNHDFDGYILRLLQGPHKRTIASQFVPPGQDERELLKKAEQEITKLMDRNGFPWTRNKSWLYAYITAFQFRQSHVWFAKEVVEKAPKEVLRDVFASLIAAWNLLVYGTCQGGDR